MSNRDEDRLADIHAAIAAIRSHLERGTLTDGLVFDAVRMRLLEIGEAVKAISGEPGPEYAEIALRSAHAPTR